jgi:hypothetical protein
MPKFFFLQPGLQPLAVPVLSGTGVAVGVGLLGVLLLAAPSIAELVPFPVRYVGYAFALLIGCILAVLVAARLSRDLHVALLAGAFGIGADGLLGVLSAPADQIPNLFAALNKIVLALIQPVAQALSSLDVNPPVEAVRAGVWWGLVPFFLVLLLTLKHNPPPAAPAPGTHVTPPA